MFILGAVLSEKISPKSPVNGILDGLVDERV